MGAYEDMLRAMGHDPDRMLGRTRGNDDESSRPFSSRFGGSRGNDDYGSRSSRDNGRSRLGHQFSNHSHVSYEPRYEPRPKTARQINDENVGAKYQHFNAVAVVKRGEDVGKALRRLERAMGHEFPDGGGRYGKGIQSGSGFRSRDGRKFEKPSHKAHREEMEAEFRNDLRVAAIERDWG